MAARGMVHRHMGMVMVSLTALISPRQTAAQWTTYIYGPHTLVATAEGSTEPEPQVPEASGIVASRKNPDIFWTHNDSGSRPFVWAFRLSAADRAVGVARRMGSVELTRASFQDWEDIAAGPNQQIYILDGGDNPPCKRTNKHIHRFVEPAIAPNGPPVKLVAISDSIRFEYPDPAKPSSPADSDDERYDAETMFVHPLTGDIYIVTKRTNRDVGTARVYKLPAASIAWASRRVHVLHFVADISSHVPTMPTAGDIDRDGRRVVIRTYWNAYEFILPARQPFEAIFQQTPTTISLWGEVQGEGICYAADGGDLISTSEIKFIGPPKLPFYVTPWRLANLRVDTLGARRVTIKWDTAEPFNSRVEYGTTTQYGSSRNDEKPVKKHAIELPDVSPAATYFYRAISGPLAYPPPTAAGRFIFPTTQP